MKTLDPWDIIRVPKTTSKENLKKVYKQLAKRFHPDKPTGDKKKFMILNWSYREIKAYIASRDSSFDTLKAASKNAVEKSSDVPFDQSVADFAKKDFNIDKFNQMFEKFHVSDYKPKKIEPPPEDVEFPEVINGDVNTAY